jgi:hypothetical protein
MSEGVGASQVMPYVEALSRRGMDVRLHSLEKGQPSRAIAQRLEEAGVTWRPHRWGRTGSTGGLVRLVRGAAYLRGADLVHARSDLPAGSALLAQCPSWVWDMRGFWADERIAVGTLRPGSPQERLMRMIELGSARRAGGIVTLTSAAIDVLEQRHGKAVRDKARVITTCVDLDRFPLTPMPPSPPLRLLLAGTLSRRYDLPLMLRLVEELRRRRPTLLTALVPEPSPWDSLLVDAGAPPRAASISEMPGHIADSHVGLCVLRQDGGVSMRASMPTKIGEFLASGRPVVVNAGLGDLDDLVSEYACGTVLACNTQESLRQSADAVQHLVENRLTPDRCRALAESHFDLDRGITALTEVYETLGSKCSL